MTSKEIILKYPELFGEPPFDPTENLICFGFEVGTGWLPILEEGFEELSQLIKSDPDLYEDFKIVQVNKNFGSPRIYSNFYTDAVDIILNKMEARCTTTCESCGSPDGKIRESMWMAIRCDKCYAEYERKMYG